MKTNLRRTLALAVGVFAAELITNQWGWWWTTVIAGLMAGALGRRLCRHPVISTAAASALAWVGGAALAAGDQTLAAASSLSALALGDPHLGVVLLVVTGGYAAVLALTAAWVAAAARRLFAPAPARLPAPELPEPRTTPNAKPAPGTAPLTEETQYV